MGEPFRPCRPDRDREVCLEHRQELGKCVEALQAEVEELRAALVDALDFIKADNRVVLRGGTVTVANTNLEKRVEAALARAGGGAGMNIRPLTITEANELVARFHRHHV